MFKYQNIQSIVPWPNKPANFKLVWLEFVTQQQNYQKGVWHHQALGNSDTFRILRILTLFDSDTFKDFKISDTFRILKILTLRL